MDLRAAIVGAGPAGFYAADGLLAADVAVDMYDQLPTPFGLVRSGVAPDHPNIKSVSRVFEKTARHERFRFFGGLRFGTDIRREDLLAHYNAVVYAVGASDDRRLNIPGEDRPGSVAATEFVAWYNGHPHFADWTVDLSAETAVVIGNGNVALDVARILALDPRELAVTDIADHALAALARSHVKHVVVLGRRGPAQAAFTLPELRELAELPETDVLIDPHDLEIDRCTAEWLDSAGSLPQRTLDLLREIAARPRGLGARSIELRFCLAPIELVGPGVGGRVEGALFARNRLELSRSGAVHAVPTSEQELLACGLVVRAIGYRGTALPGVPFDRRTGVIINDRGRVCTEDGELMLGEYAVGWIKRGARGVIGTNKKDAAETVDSLLADARQGLLTHATRTTDEHLPTDLPTLVTWGGWENIDAHECRLGRQSGRPRVKLVTMDDLLRTANRTEGVAA